MLGILNAIEKRRRHNLIRLEEELNKFTAGEDNKLIQAIHRSNINYEVVPENGTMICYNKDSDLFVINVPERKVLYHEMFVALLKEAKRGEQ